MGRRNYVENSDLIYELKKYHKTQTISQNLHEMLLLMSKRISLKAMYREKTYRQDMIYDAYLKCLHRINMFDMNKNNPFAYFQSVIENMFKDIIFKNERESIYKVKMQLKQQNELAQHYKLYEEIGNIEMQEEQKSGAFRTIIWNKNYLGFKKLKGELKEQIQHFFVEENLEKLLKTKGQEIIYLNDCCDNINGHCICEKCKNKQFSNKYGRAIMEYRQEMLDLQGFI